jgi:hypothetical protein
MESINETFVFESQETFMEAVYKELHKENPIPFNGVCKEFAKEHPNYDANNQTNAYCWNCLDCNNCIACDNCTDCNGCRGCDTCDSCIQCEKCKSTRYSVWCENINNSLNCHFVQYKTFNEVGFKNRMDMQIFQSYNNNGDKVYFVTKEDGRI